MTSIVVTGAAGAVGRRTVKLLAVDPTVDRVVALDRRPIRLTGDIVTEHSVDLLVDDLAPLMVGADRIVHLAEDGGRRDDAALAERMLDRVLDGADGAGVRSLVVLSSAVVYGAHEDNPVPIPESAPVRPIPELDFAMSKQRIEQRAAAWAESRDARLAVLRPTTTLSETGSSWVAETLRSATILRPDQVDPPVQFLHHDDLASAVALVVRRGLEGAFNVAPDGWIGSEVLNELIGGIPVRVPDAVADRLLELRRRYGIRSTPIGIDPYVRHPWVVANDRLRAAGWLPAFSNEEAFVVGTPTPPWVISAQRRQEVALAAAGLAVAGVSAAAAGLARRAIRDS